MKELFKIYFDQHMARKMSRITKINKLKAAGVKQLQSQQFLEAKKTYHSIHKMDNKDVEAILNLGAVYAQLKDYLKAYEYFKSANNILPNNVVILTNLGRSSLVLNEHARAISYLTQAIKIDNNNSQIKNLLAQAYLNSGDTVNAIIELQSILKLNPSDYQSTVKLGSQYLQLSQNNRAMSQFEIAIDIDKNSSLAYTCMAQALVQEGKLNEAEEFLGKSLVINPKDNRAITIQAIIARFKGEYEKAYNILSKQVNEGYLSASLLINFAAIANAKGDIQEAIDLIENNIDKLPLDASNKRHLYFSLGKLYDHKGQYDIAFDKYRIANQMKHTSFSIEAFEQEIEAIKEFYQKNSIQDFSKLGSLNDKPVFIIGMPRSGSTLVDQILSAHEEIDSVGESNQLNNIYRQITGTHSLLAYREIFQPDSKSITAEFSDNYIREIEHLTGNKDATKIIDKTLINFLHLALIQVLFPKAKIIHCTRNPLDNCLSSYFQDFIGAYYEYSFDLIDLGRYYNAYIALMRYWEENLTIPIYNIKYEDLVNDPEKHSKDLLRFLDVEWDEKCLKYYESRRAVVTSSSEQVRKPIYSKSVYRYKSYEKHLQPLMDTLDDHLFYEFPESVN